jgi:hypothetical protein
MLVGSSTFTGDLARRLGMQNAFADHPERYPASTHARLGRVQDRALRTDRRPDRPHALRDVRGHPHGDIHQGGYDGPLRT